MPIDAIQGLNRKPTEQGSPNTFFFTSPLLSQRLATLNNMVGGRSQIIVITGEHGSGKTTLLKQFMALSYAPWQSSRIRLKSRHHYATSIGSRLNNRKVFMTKSDGLPSVIIDDAHQLSRRAFQALLLWAFNPNRGPRLRSLLLLADTRMRRRYDEIAAYLPSHSVIDKIHMTPLTEEQTAAYLDHHMKRAGELEAITFSDKQIRTIHRTSMGWPGLINREADSLLRKKRGTPPFQSIMNGRIWPLGRVVNGWAKSLGLQNLKRVIKMDPTPWVP